MTTRISVESGSEYLLPFAKRKLAQLKDNGLLTCRVDASDGARIFIHNAEAISKGAVDTIRISGGSHDGFYGYKLEGSFTEAHKVHICQIQDSGGEHKRLLTLELGAEDSLKYTLFSSNGVIACFIEPSGGATFIQIYRLGELLGTIPAAAMLPVIAGDNNNPVVLNEDGTALFVSGGPNTWPHYYEIPAGFFQFTIPGVNASEEAAFSYTYVQRWVPNYAGMYPSHNARYAAFYNTDFSGLTNISRLDMLTGGVEVIHSIKQTTMPIMGALSAAGAAHDPGYWSAGVMEDEYLRYGIAGDGTVWSISTICRMDFSVAVDGDLVWTYEGDSVQGKVWFRIDSIVATTTFRRNTTTLSAVTHPPLATVGEMEYPLTSFYASAQHIYGGLQSASGDIKMLADSLMSPDGQGAVLAMYPLNVTYTNYDRSSVYGMGIIEVFETPGVYSFDTQNSLFVYPGGMKNFNGALGGIDAYGVAGTSWSIADDGSAAALLTTGSGTFSDPISAVESVEFTPRVTWGGQALGNRTGPGNAVPWWTESLPAFGWSTPLVTDATTGVSSFRVKAHRLSGFTTQGPWWNVGFGPRRRTNIYFSLFPEVPSEGE